MKALNFMRIAWVFCLLFGTFAWAEDSATSREKYARHVVGLDVTYQAWDEDRPWAKQTPKNRSVGAVVVEGPYLLTSARWVENATLIQLSTFGRSRPVQPRIVHVDADVNLALLGIDDPVFWEDLAPVRLAGQTPGSDALHTVRWRNQQIEAASTRVTRFQVATGWGGQVQHAFVQLRTDMPGGGWTEPVFAGDELIGLTDSQSSQNSRAIPVEIIRAYLTRVQSGREYVGFSALGVNWQSNSDPAVTKFLGQQGESRGILIRQIPWGTSACGVLKSRDILVELGGHPIDAEGYYLHEKLGRLRFGHILAEEFPPGSHVPIRVLRGGREIELTMLARGYPSSLDLLPSRREGAPPYVIVGGLIMRELDLPYLQTWGKDWDERAPLVLRTRYLLEKAAQTPAHRRTIVLSAVLPATYNVGYESLRDQIVDRVNGRPIGSIADVIQALQERESGFHVIDLAAESDRGRVVLDADRFGAATSALLEAYRIPAAARLPEIDPAPGGGVCPGDY
jgi:hypothetical protein